MLKLCLANAIFVINYPRKKKLFGAIFNNIFTLSSTSCWSFSFAWLNSWKAIIYKLHVLCLLIISQAGP